MSIDPQALWYINGRWVHPNAATIPITDVAVLRGYSLFESLRTYNRHPFHLREHLERLYRSAEHIELVLPFSRDEITDIVQQVIERNTYQHASLRILITGGQSTDGIIPDGLPTLSVLITPLGERDMERFARGVHLITTHLHREMPEAKTTSYISAIRALKEAARHDATDALFVNEHGHVLEGTRSNFFIFLDDLLITPRTGILLGVTRQVVLELARSHFKVEERPILLEELSEADEAFITGSSREITPVVRIDDRIIGTGQPGPRTYELEQRFIDMVERGDF
ncbi:MAG: aminotransferase class IV family protein [Ktedonobacteraceae bacterium]|nr:aminotransferase class IV family protein [Ktedonobacteraceae bacterium]MBO0793606.1 aminotransferase class IV family protein [Ktedonobacteraceae bacterium]